jgi:hypothetical protein
MEAQSTRLRELNDSARTTHPYPLYLYNEDLVVLSEIAELFGCSYSEAFRTAIRHGVTQTGRIYTVPERTTATPAKKWSCVLREQDLAAARWLAREHGLEIAETMRRCLLRLWVDLRDYRQGLTHVSSG